MGSSHSSASGQLRAAIEEDDGEAVRRLLGASPQLLLSKIDKEHGHAALHVAVTMRKLAMIELLVSSPFSQRPSRSGIRSVRCFQTTDGILVS